MIPKTCKSPYFISKLISSELRFLVRDQWLRFLVRDQCIIEADFEGFLINGCERGMFVIKYYMRKYLYGSFNQLYQLHLRTLRTSSMSTK